VILRWPKTSSIPRFSAPTSGSDNSIGRRPFGPWFCTIVLRGAIKAATRRDRQESLEAAVERDSFAASNLLVDRQAGPEGVWDQA
jgi:hypothetical protein